MARADIDGMVADCASRTMDMFDWVTRPDNLQCYHGCSGSACATWISSLAGNAWLSGCARGSAWTGWTGDAAAGAFLLQWNAGDGRVESGWRVLLRAIACLSSCAVVYGSGACIVEFNEGIVVGCLSTVVSTLA